jgi:hypothetical protein
MVKGPPVKGGHRGRSIVLYAPGTDAKVFGIQDHGHILSLQHALQFRPDLVGQPLLYLRATGVILDNAV